MKINIRILYLYLFSFVGLLITVIGGISAVNLGIKTTFFKDADNYEVYSYPAKDTPDMPSIEEQKRSQEVQMQRNRQRELSQSMAMILVGVPLYMYHWRLIKKEE